MQSQILLILLAVGRKKKPPETTRGDEPSDMPVTHSHYQLSPDGDKLYAIQASVKPCKVESVPIKGTKTSYTSMSEKSIDKALDVKILDYLSSSGGNALPKEEKSDISGDISFGQSAAVQLRTMDQWQNALGKAKIQLLLLHTQFPSVNPNPNVDLSHYDGPAVYPRTISLCY